MSLSRQELAELKLNLVSTRTTLSSIYLNLCNLQKPLEDAEQLTSKLEGLNAEVVLLQTQISRQEEVTVSQKRRLEQVQAETAEVKQAIHGLAKIKVEGRYDLQGEALKEREQLVNELEALNAESAALSAEVYKRKEATGKQYKRLKELEAESSRVQEKVDGAVASVEAGKYELKSVKQFRKGRRFDTGVGVRGTRIFGAAGGGGGGYQYIRSVLPDGSVPVFSGARASVANRAYACPCLVEHNADLVKVGINPINVVNGNLEVGLYDAAFNRLATSGALAVAGLVNNTWNWFIPALTPNLPRGIYWIAWSCDTVYAAAVSGMQINTAVTAWQVDVWDAAALGNMQLVNMNGAYPLPAVFVPANFSISNLLLLAIEVVS